MQDMSDSAQFAKRVSPRVKIASIIFAVPRRIHSHVSSRTTSELYGVAKTTIVRPDQTLWPRTLRRIPGESAIASLRFTAFLARITGAVARLAKAPLKNGFSGLKSSTTKP